MKKTWSFDDDYLFDLVLSNRKHGTCCLYEHDNKMSKVGDINIIYNSHNQKIKIQITNVHKCRFCDVNEQWAKTEGEEDLSLAYWKKIHLDFFKKEKTDFKSTDMLELNEFTVIK